MHHEMERPDVLVPFAPVGLDGVVLNLHHRAVADVGAAADLHALGRIDPGLAAVCGVDGIVGFGLGDGVL